MNILKIYSLGVVANWGYFSHHINKEVRDSMKNKKSYNTNEIDNATFRFTTICAFLWPFLLPNHLVGNFDISIETKN